MRRRNRINLYFNIIFLVTCNKTGQRHHNQTTKQYDECNFLSHKFTPPFIILAKKQTSFRISKFYHSIYSSSINYFWQTKTHLVFHNQALYIRQKLLKTPKIVSSCVAGGARRRRKIACRHRICRCRYARVCSRFCKGNNICKPCIFRLFACFL